MAQYSFHHPFLSLYSAMLLSFIYPTLTGFLLSLPVSINHQFETLGFCVWVFFYVTIWVTLIDVSLWSIIRRTLYDLYMLYFVTQVVVKLMKIMCGNFVTSNKNNNYYYLVSAILVIWVLLSMYVRAEEISFSSSLGSTYLQIHYKVSWGVLVRCSYSKNSFVSWRK